MRRLWLCLILSVHAAFTFVMVTSGSFSPPKKKHQPIVVKTMTIEPKVETKASPLAATVAPLKKEAAVQEKKPAPKKKEAPSTAPAKKPEPQRARISDALMRDLEESIAKIDQKQDKGSPKAPQKGGVSLRVDQIGTEGSYADALASRLHGLLNLPEYGSVKLQLTVRKDGTVTRVNVIHSESEKNRRYLEQQLTSLQLPRLDGPLAVHPEWTFVLTFCNEI